MIRKKQPTSQPSQNDPSPSPVQAATAVASTLVLPFVDHIQELRRRLYYIAASVIAWGCAAYGVQHHIVDILLRPAEGQHFIYTTPGGGIDFLFRICVYAGLIFSLPVIVYNCLRFIEPLISRGSTRFILWGSAISGLLAAAGMVFGYFLGLPAALHFLLHQFTTAQIQPLVTIQSYFGFVVVYMVGSALLFQLPLLLILINRIKPLDPRRLLQLKYQRWVILVSFILAVLMNPTPNVVSQLLIAGPFVLMYQIGIGLVALVNRQRRPNRANHLATQDTIVQAQRQQQATPVPPAPAAAAIVPPAITPTIAGTSHSPQATNGVSQPIARRPAAGGHTTLPRQRFMDFVPRATAPTAPSIDSR